MSFCSGAVYAAYGTMSSERNGDIASRQRSMFLGHTRIRSYEGPSRSVLTACSMSWWKPDTPERNSATGATCPPIRRLWRGSLLRRGIVMLGAFVPVALKDASAHAAGQEAAVKTARLLAAVARIQLLSWSWRTKTAACRNVPSMQGESLQRWGYPRQSGRHLRKGQTRSQERFVDATGLRTVFHHHCAGYVETPDEISRFLELTDPQTIGLVFDTGHYVFGSGGCDVLAGLNRFKERIWYVHLKDCRQDLAERSRQEHWDYFQSLRHGIFCELGRGCVNFAQVLQWLKIAATTVMFWSNRMCCPAWGLRDTARCATANICARWNINSHRGCRGRKRLREKRLQIGIIGAGRIGRVHAESLAFRIPKRRLPRLPTLTAMRREMWRSIVGSPA